MRLARATRAGARCGGATEPEAVLAGPRGRAAGAARTRVTGFPSSRNAARSSGKIRCLPWRSSSVTPSFSQPTTAPQNAPSAVSTTRPRSASTSGAAGRRGFRTPSASTSRP